MESMFSEGNSLLIGYGYVAVLDIDILALHLSLSH